MREELEEERRGRVAILTINRPHRLNALSPELLTAMGDKLRQWAQEGDVRAVVIRGAGGKAFSAGYDIGRIGQTRGDPLRYGLEAVQEFPYPVIAAIRGFAIGAGLHLAVACDLRIASPSARFSMPPVRLGIVYPIEGYEMFVRTIGPAAAKALFLTGRQFTAQEALQMGLVHRVEPEESLEEEVMALAQELAEECAPLAVQATKFIINRLALGPLSPEDVARARQLMVQAFQSEDAREAQAAFAEKRKPRFSGR
jgi:enoyl-CoA hydratase/carnithine racemase